LCGSLEAELQHRASTWSPSEVMRH
jgi:hypothetical protein